MFEIEAGSNAVTTLASFNGTNGAEPRAGLIEDSSGNLFGTTDDGGADNDGTVFEIAAGSGAVTTLATFNDTNGADPNGGLIEDSSGNLFGTTTGGGSSDDGTVFEIGPAATSSPRSPPSTAPTGPTPGGHLIEDSSGNLFGTTDERRLQ